MSHLRLAAFSTFIYSSFFGLPVAAQHSVDEFVGRELFERVWEVRPGDSGKLGPLYNERSCVACHRLGAIGGAGLNARNVQLVSVEIPDRLREGLAADGKVKPHSADQQRELNRLRSRVRQIHSGLGAGSMVLHAYAVDSRYTVLRDQVLGLRPTDLRLTPAAIPAARPPYVGPIRRVEHDGVTLLVSERNSTAMFGAGLVDRISVDDIKAAADEQAAKHPEMKGRFLGRFGWRGQTLDLRSFVAGACSVELGLTVPGGGATRSPVAPTVTIRQKPLLNSLGNREIGSLELDDLEFSSLVAFVSSLPAPGRREPIHADQIAQVRHGEQVFEAARCAVCHRPTLGKVAGLYSDLLLHDLGPGLYDPQPSPSAVRSAQYYDSGPTLGDYVGIRPYEWRTPPLWGLADSGPYMHDGRALTVAEAVMSHGGQAESSVRLYQSLSDSDRRALLTFLSSLVAPDADYLKKPLAEVALLPGMHPQEKRAAEEAASKQVHAEQAAGARLRLASQATERGEPETARVWLESVLKDFPYSQAATEATAQLKSRSESP